MELPPHGIKLQEKEETYSCSLLAPITKPSGFQLRVIPELMQLPVLGDSIYLEATLSNLHSTMYIFGR